jgi:hypothetical protein
MGADLMSDDRQPVQFMSQRADAAEFRTPKAPRTGAREPWERTS